MITNREKLLCAERELAYRHRVYVRLVTRDKMTPNEARHEIVLMSAIVDDYRALVADEEPDLFADIQTRRTLERGP